MPARADVPRLLLITDSTLGDPLAGTCRALEGMRGLAHRRNVPVAVQMREKTATGRALLDLGRALREATGAVGVRLLVNGRVDIALAVGADGVHLPERGMTPADARALLGVDALVGVSRHDAAGLAAAAREGADYATLSPFAPSPGKGAPLGAERFASMARGASLPVLALGGVDEGNARAALEAGAHGVAVIRAVYGAADPARAVTRLLSDLDRVRGVGR